LDLIAIDLAGDSPLREFVEEIRHASERAAGLTRQLLVFSRKETVQPVVLDLNEVVKNLDKMLRRVIGEAIAMTMVPGREVGRVKADAGYVGQVVLNLVVNARDAMPNGGRLTITTENVSIEENSAEAHPKAAPGEYVLLKVSDTGHGMTAEVKQRLFEPFFTTKAANKGTGLGLATCHNIVQQCKGFIEVESEPGQGTTFRVYFPRIYKPLSVAATRDPSGSLPRGTERLLLVEDDRSLRIVAHRILQAQGYEVLTAANGLEALQVVNQAGNAPIRLVVTDVVMPEMGGMQMAEWLKANDPELKILFTSGYTDEAIAQHGSLDASMAFLPKPYTPMMLARKVRAVLDNPAGSEILEYPA
jgi:CheY-like chemotaxis protein